MEQRNPNPSENHEPKQIGEYLPEAIDQIVSSQEASELYDKQSILLGRLRKQKDTPGAHQIEEEISDVHERLAKFSAESERKRSNTQ